MARPGVSRETHSTLIKETQKKKKEVVGERERENAWPPATTLTE